MRFPVKYINNIILRFNLYKELSQIKDEANLKLINIITVLKMCYQFIIHWCCLVGFRNL